MNFHTCIPIDAKSEIAKMPNFYRNKVSTSFHQALIIFALEKHIKYCKSTNEKSKMKAHFSSMTKVNLYCSKLKWQFCTIDKMWCSAFSFIWANDPCGGLGVLWCVYGIIVTFWPGNMNKFSATIKLVGGRRSFSHCNHQP